MKKNDLILAENQYYNMNSYETKLNNNVLVVGTSGSGKTRHIVEPNLLQASGSYVVSDPKGNLYRKYKDYLKTRGYEVKLVDFVHPGNSVHYNPLAYIRGEQDILKMAHMLIGCGELFSNDPFWEQATELLFTAILGYQWIGCKKSDQTLSGLQKLVAACQVQEDSNQVNALDRMMEELEMDIPDNFASRQYTKFRVAASRTLKSILITANAKLGMLDTVQLRNMLSEDEIDFPSIGQKKTAVFVVVSDTDRSMDMLANMFFTQAMSELCRYADDECNRRDNRLPVDVRFILDDFATNVKIEEFPRMIASIRSRGISAMLMIQAEGQLTNAYHQDDKTIIGNCDSYIYLGGNDIDTAYTVARRCDIPMKKILNMPVQTCWVFRRGETPVFAQLYDLDKHKKQVEKER